MHNPHDLVNAVFKPTMTHAHFNTDSMEEVINELETSGWIFGRNENAFIGLYVEKAAFFLPGSNKDLISEVVENVYILEAGNEALYGTFEEFIRIMNSSEVSALKFIINQFTYIVTIS